MTMTQRPSSSMPPAASHNVAIRNTFIAAVTCSFLLLTLVVVVQARTIETQRNLIRDLFADSGELRALREAHAAENKARADGSSKPSQTNPALAPRGLKAQSAPLPKAPAAQSHPKIERQGRKKLAPVPPPPPPRAIDAADSRRDASIT